MRVILLSWASRSGMVRRWSSHRLKGAAVDVSAGTQLEIVTYNEIRLF